MKKYVLAIEELIVKSFEVEAKSSEEAMEIAIKKYKNGEFVLDNVDVSYRQIALEEPISTDWVEF